MLTYLKKQDEQGDLNADSINDALASVYWFSGLRYKWDDNGQHRTVFVRACANFNGDGPWYDSAVVQFQTGTNANQQQMGYVRISGCLAVDGNHLIYVRWYTNLPPGGALDNLFMTSLNRHLPALKWNPRTQTCNKSYGLIEPSSLRYAAWVVPDCKQENLFWHIKSRNLHVHHDPDQMQLISE